MLKFIFWTLLLANGAALGFNLGYLDGAIPDGREPQRIQRQMHPEQLILLTAGAKAAAATAGAVLATDESTPPALAACTEIGNFQLAEAKRFEMQLAALGLGERQSRRNVTEVASHIVYIPPQGDQAAAQKKVAELRRRGITNFFIMQDNSALHWGISLGVFKTEAAAKNLLAALRQQGVQSARIGTRSAATSNVVFQMRDLDPAATQALARIAADFPQQRLRNCE